MTFKEIADATRGVLKQGSSGSHGAAASGISVDTRTLREGEVFFALKGPNFDGHAFISEALGKKASGVVVEKGSKVEIPDGLSAVFVEDTLRALGDTAASLRRRVRVPLVAVSGSTGKTTTKEMAAAILARSRPVLKTEGNRNNLVGLPLTLSGINSSHRAAVVELGISGPGEMKRLVEISDPDVALITNIGRSHMEGHGDIEGVAGAKRELFDCSRPECFKVVNLDDELVVRSAEEHSAGVITFGFNKEADVRVEDFRAGDNLSGSTARFFVRGEPVDIRLRVPGVFNMANAAAAVAALLPLDVYLDDIYEGLYGFTGVSGRLEIVRSGALTILDDTYNANPESVSAALGALKGAAGRRVAVLGEMHELGECAEGAHRETGRLAAEAGIDMIVAVGRWSSVVVDGALDAGFRARLAYGFDDWKSALKALKGDLLKAGDVLLVKGSRAAGLEEVVRGLSDRDNFKEACC